MKSYIIKIELVNSHPLIWRRVIMPAGATYKRLHDIIQNTTNFQGGYPYSGYHLYEFDLKKENKIVTDDEEMYLQHQDYKKNKKLYEERLQSIPSDLIKFKKYYQDRLKTEVYKPRGLKIDSYLEKYKKIKYIYDFGDSWEFIISLEKIVDDYYFGFPTLLDGAETAPPEDIGGIDGFYEFIKIYNDKNHSEHEHIKAWAESMYFEEYNPALINERLKDIKYKKTEWNKIKHVRYKVIDDKYRKG